MNHDRRRDLYDRFVKDGVTGFLGHESVELLLSTLFPSDDVGSISKSLKARFGNLRGILDAPLSELESVAGIGAVGAVALRIIRETASLYLLETAENQASLANTQALETFWKFRIGGLPYEVFQVAFLNSNYQLLHEGVEQFARA